MKKIIEVTCRILLILLFVVPYIVQPIMIADAAKGKTYDDFTLKEMRKELENLKADKIKRQNEKKQTQAEINKKKEDSLNAKEEKESIDGKVEALEKQIAASEVEIERLTAETNELLKFIEVTEGTNVYLDYIMSATTITELLVKTATVDQMTKHNESIVKNLKTKIQQNNEKKEELRLREIELEAKIKDLSNKLNSLGDRLKEISEISLDIDTEIRILNDLVTFYKGACKNENQKVSSCVDIPVSTRWVKPLNQGKITSDYGYRTNPITGKKNSYHGALDIGGNAEGTNLYAPASGMVAAVIYRASCGGNQVFIHININGQPYTVQMVHLLSYNVKVGDKVTINTVVGKVGGGSQAKKWDSCSTGAHLHYAVSKGYYKAKYSDFLANDLRPPGFPAKGAWFYSRF